MGLDNQADTVTLGRNNTSFHEFVGRSADHLFTMALLLKSSHAEAEDLLQDALERVYRRWRRIARNGKPESAVYKILVKETIAPGRRMLRRSSRTANKLRRGAAHDQAQATTDVGDFRRALTQLPPGERAALVLRYFVDLPDEQAAVIMGRESGEVKIQASRGLARMRGTAWPSSGQDISARLDPDAYNRKALSDLDEVERRVRAAMSAASERAPAGLIDGIRQRHRAFRARMWLGYAAAAAIALAISIAIHVSDVNSPPTQRASTGFATFPSSSASPPTVAPGTVLLSCDNANWGKLPSNWRDGGLKVGALTFVYGRLFGYVHDSTATIPQPVPSHSGKYRLSSMIVEVAYGATVVIKSTPEARSYFRFVKGFDGSTAYELPKGDAGFTLASCPRGTRPGPNGRVTDFYLGYRIQAGSSAVVDVWKSVSAPPTKVTFTSDRH